MKITIAENLGFCFGVQNAFNESTKALQKDVCYINGDLVHNENVVNYLEKLGLKKYETNIPRNKKVIIRSHGVCKEIKEKLIANQNEIIDLTCPCLKAIYKNIIKWYNNNYKIVIVGNKSHPEVKAMNSLINYNAIVVATTKEASEIFGYNNLYVISQTTNILEKFLDISDIINSNNKNVIIENTICAATRKRQDSAYELAKRTNAMIVIGSKTSSNSNKLFEICKKVNNNTFFINSAKELDLSKILKYNNIGITAGASTPSWIIEEVASLMENLSKDEFMEQVEDSITRVSPRDIVKGEIIYVTDDEVIVNIGYKADGIVKLDELSTDENVKPKDLYKEGQEIEVYVIKLDDGEGNVVLSTRRVESLKNWETLVEDYKNENTVTVKITKDIKGGLLGIVKGVVAFLPGSQITTHFVKDFSKYIGMDLDCKIISIDEKKRRLVVSRKVIEEAENQKKLEEAWSKLEEGQVLTGKVARLTDFGAFISLGDIDGLAHVSDISWNRINKPSDVLTVGDEVEVLILKLNDEKKRISLGIKQLTKKPFEQFMEDNKVGDVVKGTVVNLVDFGAFVRLKEGVEGLIHISQISHNHIEKASDELNVGQEVDVKILEINPEEKRIALSIKALTEPPKREDAPISDDGNKPQRPRRKRNENREKKRTKEIEGFKNEDLDTSIGALLDFKFSDSEEPLEKVEDKVETVDAENAVEESSEEE